MASVKRFKTPLRYAGGKSKAIYKLEKCLPKDMDTITEVHDCFLGGGSFPIYLSKIYPDKNIKVNEIYKPVYNFWIQLRDNDKLSDSILELKKNTIIKSLLEYYFNNNRKLLRTMKNQILKKP